MSEIPDDIMQAAQQVCEQMEEPFYPSPSDLIVIANAILAERERCAKVAREVRKRLEGHLKPGKRLNQFDEHVASICDDVAAAIEFSAIRGGSHE